MKVDTEKIWDDLSTYFGTADLSAEWTEIRKAPFASLANGRLKGVIQEAVKVVERATKDMGGGLGDEKKEALIQWIDEVIQLPAILDKRPLDLDRRIISKIIDEAVEWWNKTFGHDWFKNE